MSAHDDHAGQADHTQADGPHGTLRDYAIGFALSVVLTAVPFWLVMARPLAAGPTAAIILGFAAVQMLVHAVYFLHMNGKAEGGWSMTAAIFTVIIVVIMLTGSLWVMYHLNHNMMPMPHDMSQMP
jgi:cytochrome o ubiquinol oxidase operon protein cyoD